MENKIANDSAERRYIEINRIQNAMRSTRHNNKKKKEKKKKRRRFRGFGECLLQFAPSLRSISAGYEGVRGR